MEGKHIDVPRLLAARDRRAEKQTGLLTRFQKPLICLTMNIPGPVKDTPLIRKGFRLGCRMVRDQLQGEGFPLLYTRELFLPTGCEGYYIVDAPAQRLKTLMGELEDSRPVARLFDLDVLTPDGGVLERGTLGLAPRKCLLCDQPAKVCGRSRTHGLPALTGQVEALLLQAIREEYALYWGQLAAKALLYEVCATPKPGLVDRKNSGSHRDMDIFTFLSSTAALQPYFTRCARLGMETAELPPGDTFRRLRLAGKEAEGDMLRATGGVNTHKGAVFTIGLLCGALGRLGWNTPARPEDILSQCAAMVQKELPGELSAITEETAHTHGQQLYIRWGITGIRGQAAAGFPAVGQKGLPVLREALAQGHTLEEAGRAALLAIMTVCQDTNLLRRGGAEGSRQAIRQVKGVLAETQCPDEKTLEALDQAFIAQGLSPGGSADLLAATYLMHFVSTAPDPLSGDKEENFTF